MPLCYLTLVRIKIGIEQRWNGDIAAMLRGYREYVRYSWNIVGIYS